MKLRSKGLDYHWDRKEELHHVLMADEVTREEVVGIPSGGYQEFASFSYCDKLDLVSVLCYSLS